MSDEEKLQALLDKASAVEKEGLKRPLAEVYLFNAIDELERAVAAAKDYERC